MFMARIHPLLTIGVLVGVTASVVPVHSQEPFYKGKTINILAGFSPGGCLESRAHRARRAGGATRER